jgi:hypothetical protein
MIRRVYTNSYINVLMMGIEMAPETLVFFQRNDTAHSPRRLYLYLSVYIYVSKVVFCLQVFRSELCMRLSYSLLFVIYLR